MVEAPQQPTSRDKSWHKGYSTRCSLSNKPISSRPPFKLYSRYNYVYGPRPWNKTNILYWCSEAGWTSDDCAHLASPFFLNHHPPGSAQGHRRRTREEKETKEKEKETKEKKASSSFSLAKGDTSPHRHDHGRGHTGHGGGCGDRPSLKRMRHERRNLESGGGGGCAGEHGCPGEPGWPFSLDTVIQAQVDHALPYLMGFRHDPYMFHQANMAVKDMAYEGIKARWSLLGLWYGGSVYGVYPHF